MRNKKKCGKKLKGKLRKIQKKLFIVVLKISNRKKLLSQIPSYKNWGLNFSISEFGNKIKSSRRRIKGNAL